MDWIREYSGWIVGVFAGVTTLIIVVRFLVRWFKKFFAKLNAATDALIGREAIIHPDTGAILVEATPSLGKRLNQMEGSIREMTEARTEIAALTSRVDSVTDKFEQHMIDVAARVNVRFEEYEDMWKAIRAIAETSKAVVANHTVPEEK